MLTSPNMLVSGETVRSGDTVSLQGQAQGGAGTQPDWLTVCFPQWQEPSRKRVRQPSRSVCVLGWEAKNRSVCACVATNIRAVAWPWCWCACVFGGSVKYVTSCQETLNHPETWQLSNCSSHAKMCVCVPYVSLKFSTTHTEIYKNKISKWLC